MVGCSTISVVLRNILIVLALSSFNISTSAQTNSLYSKDDPLWELSSLNFSQVVLRKNNAWIVEFYNSWCGHCIRFAPVWKSFARDIRGWRRVIDVAVVNCADDINVQVCRNYSVESYPTIKLFKLHATESDKGKEVSEGRSSAALQKQIIDFVEQFYRSGVPQNWPDLRPVRSSSLAQLQRQIKPANSKIILIVEFPESYVGRKVILDTSTTTRYTVRRMVSNNEPLFSELKEKVDLSPLPVLLLISEDHISKLSGGTSDEEVARKRFREALSRDPLGHVSTTTTISPHSKTEISHTERGHLAEKVYMVDLENAIRYSLKQEIGVHHILEGEKLFALKDYVQTLSKYFPGRPQVNRFLAKLDEYVQKQHHSLNVENMLHEMDKMQTREAYLPDMKEWMGCKGSIPRYRGYPCSLWTLFHTLTVQALQKYEERGINPYSVLYTISSYVKNFFTCEECSRNFQKMAATMSQELHHPNDTVLWLWKAHNEANKRLAGDLTEDPTHPKVQYPPSDICPHCHLEKIRRHDREPLWNTHETLKYLMQHYNNIHGLPVAHFHIERRSVSFDEGEIFKVKKELEPSDLKLISQDLPELRDTKKQEFVVSVNNLSYYSESWTFRYFTGTDMSLCISLYILSGLLLVILYFIFITKRRRRKIQYIRVPSMYP